MDMRWTVTLNGIASEMLERGLKNYAAATTESEKAMWATSITDMLQHRYHTGQIVIDPADAETQGTYILDFEYTDEGGVEVKLPYRVYYTAEGFARAKNGTCAFCLGDPCAERSEEDSHIARFMRNEAWAEHCPVCQGRPT